MKTLFELYPYQDTFALSSGQQVNMPFHLFSGTTAQILGVVNRDRAKRFINNHEFEPIRIPGQSHLTIGALLLQKIDDSTVGPYNETVNMFFVKRKSAPDLALPELPNTQNQQQLMDYLLTVLAIINAHNQAHCDAQDAADYGAYAQFLELDNQLAVDAGLEIWGYPKILSKLKYDISESYFSLDLEDLNGGRKVFSLSYQRDDKTAVALEVAAETILPDDYNPHTQKQAQLANIAAVHPNSYGRVHLFNGEFSVGNSRSLTAQALRLCEFKPVAVVEFTQLQAVGFHSYAV